MENREIINRLKNSDLRVYKNLENLWQMARIEEDYKLNDYVWEVALSESKHSEDLRFFDLYKKCTIYGSRYSFDKYMLATEDNRTPQARFYLPRRKILEGKHKIISQIQDFIDDKDQIFLGISLPPGTGKTTLIKFLLSYMAGRFPDSANMYVSYAGGIIEMMYRALLGLLTDNVEYKQDILFPDNGKLKVSAEYKTLSYRSDGDFPTIGLVSLGGSVTGRTRANRFLVTDDLVKDKEEARSPERLAKLYDDYNATVTTRTIGDKVKQIMLGTIWSIHDPLSTVKMQHENDKRYKFIAIPVWDEETEVSNFEYEHPDNYTTQRIRDIKNNLDPVDFSCLYLQKPIEKEGLVFAYNTLNYFNGVLPDGTPDNILFYCDVAWGGGDSLSMPIAYQYGDDVYIKDVVFSREDKTKTKPRVIGKILQHGIKMGRFEANNGGDEYCDDVDRILKEKYNYRCNLGHKKAPTNMAKEVRIERYAPDIKKFYFLGENYRDDDYKKFMSELCGYSFTSKNLHDDAPDSLAGLSDYIFKRVNATVEIGKRIF